MLAVLPKKDEDVSQQKQHPTRKIDGRTICAFVLALFQIAVVASGEEITAEVGKREVVFPDNYKGLRAFPDERISFLRERPAKFLMVSGDRTVLMQSRSTLGKAVPVKVVLAPGRKGGFDDGYAGIGGVYRDGRRVFGFYHAEQFLAKEPTPNAMMHWSVALAVSKDDGHSFEKRGQILTYGRPTTTGRNIKGCGDIAVCPDQTGTYLYGYYTETTKNERGVVICMARSKISDGLGPGTWKKFYNGEFTEPGLGGEDSPVVPFPLPRTTSTHNPHVTYIKSFKKYVMVLDSLIWPDHKKNPPPDDGTYFCYSDNGIVWSKPKPLFVGNVTIPIVDRDYSAHPGLYIQNEAGNKATGWLINTYSPRWGGDRPNRQMHHMVRRKIELSLSDTVSQTFAAGSNWIGDAQSKDLRLTVIEREGKRFKARFESKGWVREVSGTKNGNAISWSKQDVRAIKGSAGGDNEGTIVTDDEGSRIDFVWRGGGKQGTFTLRKQD